MTTPTIPTETDPRGAMLDDYDSAIGALELALRDADAARRERESAQRAMDVAEARTTAAGLEGKNELERKAFLLLALLDNRDYRAAEEQARDAADAQRDAERTVRILQERCRLLRAALGLTTG